MRKIPWREELLIKIPSVKESLKLCLTCVSTVSAGLLRGNNGPQLLRDVGLSEVAAHTLEVPCRLDPRKQKGGHCGIYIL